MQTEKFILNQMKRDKKIYSVCLKVFAVALTVFAIALICSIFMKASIGITIFDIVIMAVIAIQFPTFKRLKNKAGTACDEIERALSTPGFSFPDDYSSVTNSMRKKAVQEPKKLMTSAILILILAVTCAAFPIFIIWIESFDDFIYFGMGAMFGVILFSIVAIVLFILMLMYLKDYRTARKLRQLNSKQ